METIAQVNFILQETPSGDRFVELVIGEEEVVGRCLERIHRSRGTLISINICDVSQLPPNNAFWESSVLAPYRSQVFGLAAEAV